MDKIEQLDEILSNFDFERVRLTMVAPVHPNYDDEGNIISRGPWKMKLSPDRYDIPSTLELRDMAVQLLLSIAKESDEETNSVATGPFKASNVHGYLKLEFICEEWYCDY